MPAMWGAAMEVPDITLQVIGQTASAAVQLQSCSVVGGREGGGGGGLRDITMQITSQTALATDELQACSVVGGVGGLWVVL